MFNFRAPGKDDFKLAIYHLSAQIISRGGGRSAVAALAYRNAEKIYDERLGKTFDFTRKSGVEHTEIMLPEGAPSWPPTPHSASR